MTVEDKGPVEGKGLVDDKGPAEVEDKARHAVDGDEVAEERYAEAAHSNMDEAAPPTAAGSY